MQITYASRAGERCEILERQRGGVRVFATLDAVARCLAGLGYRVEWNDYGMGHEVCWEEIRDIAA